MKMKNKKTMKWIVITVILTVSVLASGTAMAELSSLHPGFALLSADGVNVLEDNQPVSAMETCGQCHDTEFIAHSGFHSKAGLEEYGTKAQELVEMNCFLCHFEAPNNTARIETLVQGNFEWASTATLLGTGIVNNDAGNLTWNPEAFDINNELKPSMINIQDPSSENCGQCHGTVHTSQEPLALIGCEDTGMTSETSGQVFSSQRIKDSAMNISDKEDLTRSFDIHIERGLDCVACHYSSNNPVYVNGQGADSLEHLNYDPRVLEIGEYLLKPSHDFVRSQNSQNMPELQSCDSCHNPGVSHNWLPYAEKHMEAINCQTCHIPELYAGAVMAVDNTVVTAEGAGVTSCRGIEGNTGTAKDLIVGFQPSVMLQENADGEIKYSVFNLVTTWSWMDGDTEVSQKDLQTVFGKFQAELLPVFDANQNGLLDTEELVLDTEAKVSRVAETLRTLGYAAPQIVASTEPYAINHNASNGEWAVRDCSSCHEENSRLAAPIKLGNLSPGSVLPVFTESTKAITDGSFEIKEDGALYFIPNSEAYGKYIFGHSNVRWVDWFGVIAFLGVLLGVVTHGGLRVLAARKAPKTEHPTKRVYMYSFYERLWHWLQTIAILLLTFTGLIIHKPEMFGMFSFKFVVVVHNTLAALLVANAALALFYNLVSGDIRRFIPQPQGFFNQMILQVKYYTHGIFKGEPHPEEKTREKRLNPLQKVTYFGILNVLLPLQVLTGIFMWGVQRWPEIANALGGLPFLAPFHTLVAWSFASFVLAHVYLTTTAGHTPMAGIQSMINGWDEVEVHSDKEEK